MSVALYFDVHVRRAVTEGLRLGRIGLSPCLSSLTFVEARRITFCADDVHRSSLPFVP